jgi:hypothetical protein
MERGRWEGQNFQLKEVQRLEEEEEEEEEEEKEEEEELPMFKWRANSSGG